jgi:Raf kinase inhibitor-like YbhB/YbcL family protein
MAGAEASHPGVKSRQAPIRTFAAIVLAAMLCGRAGAAWSASLQLSSAAFAAGAPIPRRYSNYGENRSPPLRWTAVAGARTYALSIQDPDAAQAHPFVHWLVWNIPGSATALPEGGLPHLPQGRNDAGYTGYFGPHPPSGVHHYHIRLFALDTPLALAPGTQLPALTAAMRGHVLATGELVATFAR